MTTKPLDLSDLSAIEARRLIGAKKISPVELLNACLERIGEVNGALNAVVAIDERGARKAAKASENAIQRGDELGLLEGLPLGVKDLQATGGLKTTWGSLIYKDHVPDADEPTVANLRDEGAIILAKTNTPEFGAGANTNNMVYGPTGNPFDPKLTCAGSSGGSAVALATGMVPLATGSDYGGSLRTPAAFCGVAGFRPSPGIVPGPERAIAMTAMPVNGPMGRTIEDAHLLLRAQLDVDKRDPFSSDDIHRIPARLGELDLGTIRAFVSTDLGSAPIDADIAGVFRDRAKGFRSFFADCQFEDPPLGDDVHEVFEILRGLYFVAAHGERLEKHRDKLGRNVIDNTERGLALTARQIAWAHAEQGKIARRFNDMFEECDVLICPAAAVSPFPHEQLFIETINGETMPTYMRWLAITYALTTAVPCAAVIPCGRDHRGLPFGIQIAGPNGADALVLEVAHALEQVFAYDPVTVRPRPDLAALRNA